MFNRKKWQVFLEVDFNDFWPLEKFKSEEEAQEFVAKEIAERKEWFDMDSNDDFWDEKFFIVRQ